MELQFIENLHQQRELWIRVVSGNQRLILPSEIEINPGWRPSSVLLMWSLDIEWENLPIPWNIFSKGPPNVFKSFLKSAIVREKKFGSVGAFSKCLPPFVYQILCLHIHKKLFIYIYVSVKYAASKLIQYQLSYFHVGIVRYSHYLILNFPIYNSIYWWVAKCYETYKSR